MQKTTQLLFKERYKALTTVETFLLFTLIVVHCKPDEDDICENVALFSDDRKHD